MKDTFARITNAPFIQKLRAIEKRKMDRLASRQKKIKQDMQDKWTQIDLQMKEDVREHIKDIQDLLDEE
jgi:hypothetical protein